MGPRGCLHKENHSLLFDGKTSLRHLSEVEDEEVGTEDSDKDEMKVIAVKSPAKEVNDKRHNLLSAHSISVISNIMEKVGPSSRYRLL